MTPTATPTTSELVDAVRAELKDFVDSMQRSDRNLFTNGGRSALKHMQRIQALLRAIDERGR